MEKLSIVYFSGTGGTARIAAQLYDTFRRWVDHVEIFSITQKIPKLIDPGDLLILLFPVYAFAAPYPVIQWIDAQSVAHQHPVCVISVSGGGEIFPNRACRHNAIKHLAKKGYQTIYEEMLVMPSNCIEKTPDELAICLLRAIPQKVNRIASDLGSGVTRRTKPKILDLAAARLGALMLQVGRGFGKYFTVDHRCSGCRLCEIECPRENIAMNNGHPVWGTDCAICLKCIYACPYQSIRLKKWSGFLIAGGYSLSAFEKYQSDVTANRIIELTHSAAYSGIRSYLLE